MSDCFIFRPKLPVHRFAHFWPSTKLRANLLTSKNVLLKFDITFYPWILDHFLYSANTLDALPLPYHSHFLMILKIRLSNASQKPRRTTKKAKKRRKKKKSKMARSEASANSEIIFDNEEEALLFEPRPNKSQQVISQFLVFSFVVINHTILR